MSPSPSKTALITGITGQDGSYLAELLLEKGYIVHGIKRRASSFNTTRIDHLYQDPHERDPRLVLHYGDLTDSTNLIRIIQEVQPDEIYNLGAQSHVAVSFEAPEYTANSDALGTLRILEAVRMLGLANKTRIYQASTSELYGMVQEVPQGWGRNETGVNATAAQYSSETAHLLEPLLASQPASQHQAAQHRRNRLVTILLDHSASMAAAHQPWIAIGTRLVDAARRVSRAAVGLWQTVSKSRTLVNTEERRPGVTLHWDNVS